MITTLTKTFTIAVQGKKEINEVVTLLRILQEFVFTPPSIQWDEIISLKIILKRQDSSLGKALTKYERPKMKRDAQQKCSLFLRKDCIFVGHRFSFSAVRISLGL